MLTNYSKYKLLFRTSTMPPLYLQLHPLLHHSLLPPGEAKERVRREEELREEGVPAREEGLEDGLKKLIEKVNENKA